MLASTVGLCVFIASLVYVGMLIGQPNAQEAEYYNFEEKKNLQKTKQHVNRRLEALGQRVGLLQARISRINAVEKRLAGAAKVDISRFDFDSEPALGGSESANASFNPVSEPALSDEIKSMEKVLAKSEAALESLGVSLSETILREEQTPDGMPVRNSWISSRYGWRISPISGTRKFHKGADIPGKYGADIIAVADGVVVRSEDAGMLGNMVEINHGDGIRTIYAHNSKNKVSVGQSVQKGDVIAELGSSGSSTGPHVHFEVRKNGRAISPHAYLK